MARRKSQEKGQFLSLKKQRPQALSLPGNGEFETKYILILGVEEMPGFGAEDLKSWSLLFIFFSFLWGPVGSKPEFLYLQKTGKILGWWGEMRSLLSCGEIDGDRL